MPGWGELCTKSRWWHLKVINVMYKRTHVITTPASWIEMCDSLTVLLVTDVQIIRHFSRFRNKNVVQMQLTRKPDVFWEGSITLTTKPLCKQKELRGLIVLRGGDGCWCVCSVCFVQNHYLSLNAAISFAMLFYLVYFLRDMCVKV